MRGEGAITWDKYGVIAVTLEIGPDNMPQWYGIDGATEAVRTSHRLQEGAI